VGFLMGRTTLLAGDSTGRVRAWFGTKPKTASTSDGVNLRAAHELPGPGSAVTALAASSLNHLMTTGYAGGKVRVYYVTSEKLLMEVTAAADQRVWRLVLVPKNDSEVGLAGLTPAGMHRWWIDPRHPEATFSSLFLPVWYEDYEKPTQVW